MKSKITLSNLEDKSNKKLMSMINKNNIRISRLEDIIKFSNDFDIELCEVQRNMINDKIKFYTEQVYKITYFMIWKNYKVKDENFICFWDIKKEEVERLRQKYSRVNKFKRILK